MKRTLHLSVVGALVAAGSIGLSAAPAYAATTTIVVGPGQSIQQAVDRAHSGDTVLIKPGHYRQSVVVYKDGLRIRGSGASLGGTVIEPSATPKGPCARHDSGICIFDPSGTYVWNVVIENLLVRGFEDSGVIAFHTRGLIVQNVVGNGNGEYGIARFDSSGGSLINNVTNGNGEAGLYIGDSLDARVFVGANDAAGNEYGILYRHATHSFLAYNDVHDNCIGIMVVAVPAPVGETVIASNTVRHNNKFCKGSEEELPFNHSGGGIVLVGARGVTVKNNAVLGNQGSTPVSGGIVLLSAAPFGGPASHDNVVKNNTAYRNSPADIIDHSGGHNTFARNYCGRSIPAGRCQH